MDLFIRSALPLKSSSSNQGPSSTAANSSNNHDNQRRAVSTDQSISPPDPHFSSLNYDPLISNPFNSNAATHESSKHDDDGQHSSIYHSASSLTPHLSNGVSPRKFRSSAGSEGNGGGAAGANAARAALQSATGYVPDFTNSPPTCRVCRVVLDNLSRVEKDRDSLTERLIAAEQEAARLRALLELPRDQPSPDATDQSLLAQANQKLTMLQEHYRANTNMMETESLRFRNDMTMKVAKYAIMCKELSEDNARVKEGVGGLQKELHQVETERNRLAKELQIGGTVAKSDLGPENQPTAELVETLQRKLERSRSKLKERNEVIELLAARLEKSTQMLSKFQAADQQAVKVAAAMINNNLINDAGSNSDLHSQMLVKTLSSQLSSERNASKNALLQVDRARTEFSRRETFLLAKIEELEDILHHRPS